MVSRRRQQLGGFLFAVLGAGLTAGMWCTAPNEGHFYGKASMLSPAFFVLGVALVPVPRL